MVKDDGLSSRELRELLFLTAYKEAVTRAQVDAVVDLLIKNKLTTYEEFWRLTQDYLRKAAEDEFSEKSVDNSTDGKAYD